ncbi:MAG: methyl-accepting chemotaxis protein [Silvanigrellaceae bacterium]
MKLKHWGQNLRVLFALIVCLPIAIFGSVTWFGFNIIADLVDVAKKSIVELPADKGIEVANLLARVHDRSEFVMLFVPLVSAALVVTIYAFLLTKFFGRLTSRSYQVVSSRDQMSKLTDKLSQTSEKIELSSQQSVAAVDQSVVQLEIISNAIQKMNAEVREADKSARSAVELSEKSESELKYVIDSLSGLVKQSKKLEEITGLIESIAFQTNILAVNAAVEAARAGDQGRGFAIVAEAVRNLAQTSSNSAKNISTLIRESGETSKRAIESIRTGTDGLASTLNEIRRSQSLIGSVVSANGELSESMARMGHSLNQLESTSKFIALAAEEAHQTRNDFATCMHDAKLTFEGLGTSILHMESISTETAKSSQDKAPGIETQAPPAEFQSHERTATNLRTNVQSASAHPVQFRPDIQKKAAAKPFNAQATTTQKATASARFSGKPRARDLIPFEGESESENVGDSRIGNISGF